jgi:hypothetical protein
MILSYQNKRFCFTEFDDDGNEHSYIWSITDFYTDFPFLPQLDMTEINSISFEDERPLYLIVYREGLNRPAVHVNNPSEHLFFRAIAENKETIKNRVYELLTPQEPEEPPRDIVKEFDEYKEQTQAIIDSLNAEITKLQGELSIVKSSVSALKTAKG